MPYRITASVLAFAFSLYVYGMRKKSVRVGKRVFVQGLPFYWHFVTIAFLFVFFIVISIVIKKDGEDDNGEDEKSGMHTSKI